MPKRKNVATPYKSNQQKKSKNVKTTEKNNTGRSFTVFLTLFVLLPSIFITLNEKYFKIEGIPDWNGIFAYFSLDSGGSVQVLTEGSVGVHFIDVGQGDCEFIQTPEYNILIDSGEKEYYQNVINYLKRNNVNKLDYVIVTHPHSDHAGGMSYIITEFKAEKIIMPELQESVIPTTGTYTRLVDSILNGDCEVIYAKPGITIELDGNTYIEIIAPVGDYDDLNNYSVVMKLIHGNNSFLFTGDIEKEAENDILGNGADLNSDVLKVAHHGSSTSSLKKFLNAVSGRYAVIGVGSPNTYNHPNDKVVERLTVQGYEILRTDLNGNIIIISDGKQLSVYAEKEYTDSIRRDDAA